MLKKNFTKKNYLENFNLKKFDMYNSYEGNIKYDS